MGNAYAGESRWCLEKAACRMYKERGAERHLTVAFFERLERKGKKEDDSGAP